MHTIAQAAALAARPLELPVLLKEGTRLLEPDVYRTRVQGQLAVVKDYGRYRHTPLAPLARLLVRREARALARLRGWAHAPMLLGIIGGLALAMEFVPGQPLGAHLWGSGFLPTKHQGVLFRAAKDPVLYLGNPEGISAGSRRMMLDRLKELHEHQFAGTPDVEISSRIDHYEMAYRMQSSIPEATDIADEPQHVLDLYGEDVKTPGTFAANCLQARRLAERGVRFIQLYHQDWDHHGGLPGNIRKLAKETDQASAALIKDLKQRGLLDDTLVIWGGEFGRTPMSEQGGGRDHNPTGFSMWMAGGGVKGGQVIGASDRVGAISRRFGTFIRRSWASLALATSPSPLSAFLSGHSMFDWPAASHTSPTDCSSRASLASSAVSAASSRSRP